MSVKFLLLAGLVFCCAPLVHAQCDPPSIVESKSVPQPLLPVRSAIYQEMCKRVGGELIDGEDATVASRLVHPAPKKMLQQFDVDEDLARLIRTSRKPAVLLYIVEKSGKVSWATVLESSGKSRLDSLAIALVRAMDFKAPITLDGAPVQVFLSTTRMGPENRR